VRLDFAAQARALGAIGVEVAGIAGLEAALREARSAERTTVIALRTDPRASTAAGGAWWDVAVPEVSAQPSVRAARAEYQKHITGA
jgi:3D-(3,5/4)-trihydroxycyclohexane-1,2-dione acylhydrolase (decyclizing)